MDYIEFLRRKSVIDPDTGLAKIPALNPMLFPHQADMVRWALRRGRAAIFADCGIGKGPMQMEWADKQPHECIIAAPLAVAHQFVREAQKFGIDLAYAKDHYGITKRITVTNYERLENFHIEQFGAVALDESSILKNYSGAYSSWMTEAFKNTPFRLCSSATPAPNDIMELGTQAEFLGVMTRGEMLAMYFTHDGGDTSKWRVKGHAQAAFWTWMASWAVMIRKPSDLGYSDDGFTLPPLHMHEHCVAVHAPSSGFLFAVEAQTLQERQAARRDSIGDRVTACSAIIARSWTKIKNANTTKHTDLPIGTRSKPSARNGMQPILNANGLAHESINQASGKNKSTQPKPHTESPIENICGITCETGTPPSETRSSHQTGSAEQNDQMLSETGICEQSSVSRSSNTTSCSMIKAVGVPSAGAKEPSDLPLTTTTHQGLSEDCFAATAISESGNLEIPPTQLGEQWIIWTNLNEEARQVAKAIPGSVNIQGSDTPEKKEQSIIDFLDGKIRVLISKSSIFGYGLNLQCCSNVVFLGLSDSFESYYQAIRRTWRFGQLRPVNVHVITAETEGAVVSNIKRKEREAEETYNSMIEHMKDLNAAALHGGQVRNKSEYRPAAALVIPKWLDAG